MKTRVIFKRLKRLYWDALDYGILGALLASIYKGLRRLDRDHEYSGETAPYCGHAYSGVNGRYIWEFNDEVGGGGYVKRGLFGLTVHYNSDEGYFISRIPRV